jgi:CelD/BcsL family acetyltransferase involved in cellulose biosynthesis
VTDLTRHLKRAWRKLFPRPFDRCDAPVELHGLRAVCHHDFPTDPALLGAWEHLLAATPSATTFHSPTWQRAVYQTQGKPDRLRLLTVWRDAQPLALLPLHIRDDGLLETLAPGVTDYLDPLILPDHESAVWPLLLKLLSKLRSGPWRGVTLHNLRDNSPTRTILPDLARREGFAADAKIVENCPALALPTTWDDYLATLDPHERKETRRKVNKAITKADARVVRCSADPTEIARSLPIALSLMEQAPGEKGEAIKRHLRPLLEQAAPRLIAENKLWLDTLHLNDEPAACTLQFPHPTGPQLYNCGFDASKREFSPGVVLTAEILRQAVESGAPTFDLLRGQEPYKYKLGATDRPLWRITLTKV